MLLAWEEVCITSDVFTSCCQQGVIALTSGADNPRYREYLIFGGVDSDYTKQSFIFREDSRDLSKSSLIKVGKDMRMPTVDKFYYQ